MNMRLLLAGALALGFTGTALADEFYVVQNPTTRQCTITTTKPADREVITQVGPLAFKTREEAEGRIKQTKVCEEGTTGSSSSTTIIKER
jgi:hypothetical protein